MKTAAQEERRFQEDVEVVAKALARKGRNEPPQTEGPKLYQKFLKANREPVRLAAALRGYFLEAGVSPEQKEEYKNYLREQIGPAMEELITEEAVEKMKALEQLGWFGGEELERFIASALTRGKSASLTWLLHLKDEKYGYQDYDFTL